VFAPSGLNDSYSGVDITNALWGSLFGPTKERTLGNALAAGINPICAVGAVQTCQNYVLLGDPSTQLVFTTVLPATELSATGGNAAVNLTWTASATPGAKYDVWRALSSPGATYVKVNPASLSTTSFTDNVPPNVPVNSKTYYYYVVALDADGFESRWSNFNSDCGVNGPDCVTATPLNPNPPAAPTGLTVTDPETSSKLNLTWAANLENDFDHYMVWWGTAPGVYTGSGNAGKATSYSLSGLVNGTTYYIALTASNTSSLTSGYSLEKTGVPTYVRGLRSPGFISTLRIAKSVSGTDAMLSWTPVTTDIYGKPATIAYYEVFRGTTPNFVPGPGNKIGQSPTASYSDLAALSSVNPNYEYLVRAVDATGDLGGLGNQLPNGIDTLLMSKTPDGLGGYTLGLSWPAVTTDFNGAPLAIDHYEVYATSHPFTRADISNALVPLLASPTTASFSVTAPSPSQYYSVLAVDARGNKSSF
jgi:hypothetical protein